MRLRCNFPTRLKLTNSAFSRSLSLFFFQLLPRPHSLIGSLQVMMMGCLVRFSRFSNSAFPPESPLSTGPSSSGRIALSTLSSEILANPPLRWSTSSSRITVFPLATPPPENWSREMCWEPCVAALLMAAAFLSSEAFNSIIVQPLSIDTARAKVVFPTPGGPERSNPRLSGGLSPLHWSSHCLIFRS